MMNAGHDTTATSLAFALHAIASHPDVQARIQDEIEEVIETTGNDGKVIINSMDQLSKLKYLDNCIKESSRFHSIIFHISRKLGEDLELEVNF